MSARRWRRLLIMLVVAAVTAGVNAARSTAAPARPNPRPKVERTSKARRDSTPTHCTITKLADGDSFTCVGGFQVRMLLIDAPEGAQRPWGDQARDHLRGLLPKDSVVRLEFDSTTTDRFGRYLAYVWAGDVMLSERMAEDGYVVVLSYENVRYLDRITRAVERAQKEKRGLWGAWGFRCLPRDFRAKRCGA
ncbi:MAG: thermonuclease family protein [Gemmatimonadaceae bacterium]|nr:thermonuclease family protein [Gemmatimonadaceae bacterium]